MIETVVRNVVPRIVAQCLARLEEDGPAGVEELLRLHPEHAEQVRARLRRLEEAGLLGDPRDSPASFPERLGPFRLIERIGGGGMGVVYLAVQEPLGRKVALKLVRPDLVYLEGVRERFHREVEVLARLKHPGVVPVYTVGEEEGLPYYAMEHVEGLSLDAVLRALSGRRTERLTGRDLIEAVRDGADPAEHAQALAGRSWVDACFHLVLETAEILDHAHRNGVLHRDVKPSNMMLTRDCRILLMDFGLARTGEKSLLTSAGTPVGSLPYMAPEQLRGEEIDERTDVYALGVTLCELLTLRSPFLSPGSEETRQRILDGVPPPVRSWNSQVPWDAETVCLTALERDRDRRYSSAAAFAADLRGFLERRPIAARRASILLRARRYGQRHPGRAVGAVLGGLLVLGGIGFGLRQQAILDDLAEANLQKAGALVALQEAGLAKDRLVAELRDASGQKDAALFEARAGFRRALGAANQMLRRVGQFRFQNVPGAETLRADLLEQAAALYRELLLERPHDPELRREAAVGFRFQGQMLGELGQLERAREALEHSLSLLEGLRAEPHTSARVLEELASTHSELAIVLGKSGRQGEELEHLYHAVEIYDVLLAVMLKDEIASDELWSARMRLAGHLGNAGTSLARSMRFAEAAEVQEEARSLLAALALERPDADDCRFRLASSCVNLGCVLFQLDDLDDADEALREGLALCEKLIEAFPSKPRNRSLAARAWFNLSLVLRRTDQPEEALEAMAVSAKLVDELARQYPAEVDHQIDRVRTMTAHGSYLCLSGRPDEATARLEEATALADRLVAEHASLPAARVIQVRALIERGHHHACTGDPARAEELLRRALDSARHLAWRWPDHAPEERDGARAARDLAAVLLRLGRLDEARRLAEEALAAEVQGPAERASGRVVALLTLADIAAAQQDHARVTSACRELLPLRAGAAEYRRAAGLAAGALAGIARDGDLDGSQRAELGAAASDCALTLLERAVEAGFDDLENLRSAGDLEPLRRLPGFEEILRQTGGE